MMTPSVLLQERLRFEAKDAGMAKIVKPRYFAGLTVDECAAVLEVSPRTVDKDWAFARAWLHRELSKGELNAAQGD